MAADGRRACVYSIQLNKVSLYAQIICVSTCAISRHISGRKPPPPPPPPARIHLNHVASILTNTLRFTSLMTDLCVRGDDHLLLSQFYHVDLVTDRNTCKCVFLRGPRLTVTLCASFFHECTLRCTGFGLCLLADATAAPWLGVIVKLPQDWRSSTG